MTLKDIRNQHKLSLHEMAERCDVSMPVYRMMEQGRVPVDERVREAVRKEFSTELE